jgi:hypothetical protein
MAVNDDGSVDFDPAGWAAAAESALHQALLEGPDRNPTKYRALMAETAAASLVSIAQSLCGMSGAIRYRGAEGE